MMLTGRLFQTCGAVYENQHFSADMRVLEVLRTVLCNPKLSEVLHGQDSSEVLRCHPDEEHEYKNHDLEGDSILNGQPVQFT